MRFPEDKIKEAILHPDLEMGLIPKRGDGVCMVG